MADDDTRDSDSGSTGGFDSRDDCDDSYDDDHDDDYDDSYDHDDDYDDSYDDDFDDFGGGGLGGMGLLGDIVAMLGGDPASLWEGARQAAGQLASGGSPEHNVNPAVRHRLSEIARVAELHVADASGLDTVGTRIEPVTRSGWVADALAAIRPLMDRLGDRLAGKDEPGGGTSAPEDLALGDLAHGDLAGLMRMMSPMTVAMTAAMMTGHLAKTAFGSSDLRVPRSHARALVVPVNLTGFADEWNLDADDVMLWVAIREHTMSAVLAVPGIKAELSRLLHSYVDGFRRSEFPAKGLRDLDLTAIEESDPGSGAQLNAQMQLFFSNPELMLGMARDDGQANSMRRLEAQLSVIDAYVDYIVARAGPRLIGSFDALTEAVRRRQVSGRGAERAGRLLGIRLSRSARERGEQFIAGVMQRAGRAGLARLWERPGALPTPNELVAPGLWLARLDLPQD